MKKLFLLLLIAASTASASAQRPGQVTSKEDSVANQMYQAFIIGIGDVMTRMQELGEQYYNTQNRDSVEALMKPYRETYIKCKDEYKRQCPTTPLAAIFLQMDMSDMPLDSIKAAYAKLDGTARATTAGKEIASEIATLEKVAPGNMAPEIAKNDIYGKPFKLSSLRGKVVLLDFWASWCGPCRQSNPHVKALYEKYKKKGFDVVYVADNDSRPEDALKAIKQDGIEKYHHVLRGLKEKHNANGEISGFDTSEDVSEQYAIHYLPTKYLIDREGKIIGVFTDENLDAKLQEIFGF